MKDDREEIEQSESSEEELEEEESEEEEDMTPPPGVNLSQGESFSSEDPEPTVRTSASRQVLAKYSR